MRKMQIYEIIYRHDLLYTIFVRGVGTGGGGVTGSTYPPPPFFKGPKVPFFVMKSGLSVQANVAVNY
jgi:hypothetical protein